MITCTFYTLNTLYDIIQRRVLERRTYDLLSYGTCKQFYIYNKTISIDYNVLFSLTTYYLYILNPTIVNNRFKSKYSISLLLYIIII